MTVSSTTSRSANQTANGANRTWPFTFRYGAVTDLVLDVTDLAGLVTIVTSGFNITPNADFSGGSIEYPISPAAFLVSGYKVRVRRVTPRKQSASMGNQGAFLPANYEAALDALEMQLQEAEENFTDVQGIYAGAGNVPAPLVGQVGQVLTATSTGVFGWASLPAASIGTSQLVAKAVTLAKLADFTGPKKILGSIQGSAVASEISLGVSLDIAAGLLNVQPRLITVYSAGASGSHVPQAWTRRMRVRGVGGGGAGGGTPNTNASEGSAGAGGAGAGYVEHEYTSIAGSYAYSVGAGGAGALAAVGGTGGNTTFGALTANGGPGGSPGTSRSSLGASNTTAPPAGGSASGGNIANTTGSSSTFSWAATGVAWTGNAGSSVMGGGRPIVFSPGGGSKADGVAATGYGAGGGGAHASNLTSGGTTTGGAGGPGILIVEEYAA